MSRTNFEDLTEAFTAFLWGFPELGANLSPKGEQLQYQEKREVTLPSHA